MELDGWEEALRWFAQAEGFGRAMSWCFLPEERALDLSRVEVEVHVPTLDEEGYIAETLRSLRKQRPIREGKVGVVVVDSRSSDRTVELARRWADRVDLVPRGKLTARHLALQYSSADIVVSADAGDVYPEGWLTTLLGPMQRPDVVGVHGPKLSKTPMFRSPYNYVNLMRWASHMSASNSAFYRDAYFACGGFDLSVDQQNREEIWREEEVAFLRRLRSEGEVVYVPPAGMFTSTRHFPFSPEADGSYQRQRSEGERF